MSVLKHFIKNSNKMESYRIVGYEFDDVSIKVIKKKNNMINIDILNSLSHIEMVILMEPLSGEIIMWSGKYDVLLLNIAISFIYEKYGKCEIQVIDTFYKTCNDYVKIPLAYYYLANFNVTWFEANFNAHPYLHEDEYNMSKKKFKDYTYGHKPTFDEFCNKYNVFPRISQEHTRLLQRQESKKNNKNKDKLSSLYMYSKNIHEFIQKVDNCDNSLYRNWLIYLIEEYFKNLMFKTWIIPILHSIPRYKFLYIENNDIQNNFSNKIKDNRHSLEI